MKLKKNDVFILRPDTDKSEWTITDMDSLLKDKWKFIKYRTNDEIELHGDLSSITWHLNKKMFNEHFFPEKIKSWKGIINEI